MRELFPKSLESERPAICAEVIRTGQPTDLGEVSDVHLKDSGIVFSQKAFPAGPRRFGLVYEDISERKQSQEELRRERDLLTTIMDNSLDHIYLKDRNLQFVRINPAVVNLLGIERAGRRLGKRTWASSTVILRRRAWKKSVGLSRPVNR